MVPDPLKRAERWILWRYVPDERGALRKVPYSARGHKASSTNPKHWATYETCAAILADDPEQWAGLGFVLGEGFAGIDLDDCRDVVTGDIHFDAQSIVNECGSYWEISPSGTGVKIYCTGEVPKGYKREGQSWGGAIEVYGWGRYFAFTGRGDDRGLLPLPARFLTTPESAVTESASERPTHWERCREAVLSLPNAICGSSAHNATLTAVCEIARWGITGQHGWAILQEFNQTKCFYDDGITLYPWSATELKHKWRDGWKHARNEVGKRLWETQPTSTVDEFTTIPELPIPQTVTTAQPVAKKRIPKFTDYPLDALEPEIAAYIAAAAETIGTVIAPVAVPFTVSAGAVIGNKRSADMTGEWETTPNLWAAVLSPSGTAKTATTQKGFRFISTIEKRLQADFVERMRQYQLYADKKKEESPERVRLTVSDTTMEALINVMRYAPHGVIVATDELAGWVESIGQYKAHSSDRAHWLEMWSGFPTFYDRASKDPPFIYLERPIISIFGNIQPGTMRSAIYDTGREDGMLQRFLVCAPPPPRIGRLHIGKIPDNITEPVQAVFDKMFALQTQLNDDMRNDHALVMSFTAAAVEAFQNFRLELKIETAALDNPYLGSHWNKLDTYAIRLAIILELMRWALGRGSDCEISETSMRAAIRLAEWHQYESYRVYTYLAAKAPSDRSNKHG